MNGSRAVFAVAVLAGVTLAGAASADEYFETVDQLVGKLYTVEALCNGDEYSTQLTDEANTANYLYLYAPEPVSDDWTEIFEKCQGGETVTVQLETYLSYGSISWRF